MFLSLVTADKVSGFEMIPSLLLGVRSDGHISAEALCAVGDGAALPPLRPPFPPFFPTGEIADKRVRAQLALFSSADGSSLSRETPPGWSS